jgi:hypothetical protein
MDNSNKKIEDQQSIAYLQNTLKKKDNLLHRKKLKTQNVDDSKNSHSFEQLCCNKQLFRHYTGYIPEEFQLLFRFLIPDLISGPYRSRGHNLSVRTQLLMTLCKLRNNFTFIDLGHRFKAYWENLVENVEVIVLLMCHDAARCIHRQIFPTCDSTNNKIYS